MRSSAQTPEELETMLEDALVIGHPTVLADLFEVGAVLMVSGARQARGGAQIARLALSSWSVEHGYVAEPKRVTQARDVALIVSEQGMNVARQGDDGAWRYAIVVSTVGDEFERSKS